MKATFLIAAGLAALASTASAQSVNWSGFYAGVSAGSFGGEERFSPFDEKNYDLSGAARSVFGGYNWDSGNGFVYGAELAYTAGDAKENSLGSDTVYSEYNYGDFTELKGRVGYAVGSALIYGALGYTFGDYEYSGTHYDLDGAVYGIGVDYLIAGKYFAGAEYVRRDLRSDYPTEAKVDTLSVRVGMKF